jgi:hypothetical protein
VSATKGASPTQLGNAIMQIKLVADLLRDVREIPRGHLYAQLIGVYDLQTYEAIIRLLTRAKLVEEDPSHLLRWVGPEVDGVAP